MPPAPSDPMLPEGATALEIPSDRPPTASIFKGPEDPAAATAVRGLADVPLHESGIKVYFSGHPDSPGVRYALRMAYACINPKTAPCCANPGPFIRRVFRTLALDLPQTFELLPPAFGCQDTPLLFRTPREREAAMRRQPFQLDGVTVKLMPLHIVLNISHGYMVHVALHDYPIEQRTGQDVADNCRRFGTARELDAACLGAPDLSMIRVVLQVEHLEKSPISSGSTMMMVPPASSQWRSSGFGSAHTPTTPMDDTCISSSAHLRGQSMKVKL